MSTNRQIQPTLEEQIRIKKERFWKNMVLNLDSFKSFEPQNFFDAKRLFNIPNKFHLEFRTNQYYRNQYNEIFNYVFLITFFKANSNLEINNPVYLENILENLKLEFMSLPARLRKNFEIFYQNDYYY